MVNDENKKEVKNILLLFLSDFKVKAELAPLIYKEEKVYNNDQEVKVRTGHNILTPQITYYGKGKFSIEARQTNEAATYYLINKYGNLDKIFIFTSNMIKSEFSFKEHEHDEEIKTIKHIDLFKKYVKEYIKEDVNDTLFVPIDYEESDDKLENLDTWTFDKNENDFKAALQMAEEINEYCKNVGNYEVRLHVDMTGGFRHANMLMLAVVDLLKYSSIKVGDIIYSNYQYKNNKAFGKIEEVTNIYNVFQLVAGVEEFTKYGSVKILGKYFNDVKEKLEREKSDQKISVKLENLITSMKNFSETLKFCRSGMIEGDIIKLKEDIKEYKELKEIEENLTEEEKVFRVLLSTIGNKYKDITYEEIYKKNNEIKFKVNIISVIKWCMRNKFYQQALTFFTELIPEYIVEKGIIYSAYNEEETKRIVGGNSYESWQKILIRKYLPQNEFFDIRKILDNYFDKQNYHLNIEELRNKIEGLERYIIFYCKTKASYNLKTIKNHRFLKNNFYKLLNDLGKAGQVYGNIKNLNGRSLYDELKTDDEKYLINDSSKHNYENAAATRRLRMARMLEKGFVKTNCNGSNTKYNKEYALDIIYDYNEICELRNIVNHASSDKDPGLTRIIKNKLKNIIEKLEDFDENLSKDNGNN